jgi:hypothetical protein
MKEIIKKLNKQIAASPESCFFNDPADDKLISGLEKKHKIRLPDSFKEFLKNFNGGFIALIENDGETDIDDLAWNSNYILALELIDELFEGINYKTEGMDVRYIPCLHTSVGEYLGFRYPLEGGESKVYDLWHEASAEEWAESVLYESFADLLKDYIAGKGEIETIG